MTKQPKKPISKAVLDFLEGHEQANPGVSEESLEALSGALAESALTMEFVLRCTMAARNTLETILIMDHGLSVLDPDVTIEYSWPNGDTSVLEVRARDHAGGVEVVLQEIVTGEEKDIDPNKAVRTYGESSTDAGG